MSLCVLSNAALTIHHSEIIVRGVRACEDEKDFNKSTSVAAMKQTIPREWDFEFDPDRMGAPPRENLGERRSQEGWILWKGDLV